MENPIHNFIAGKWVPARSGKTFETRNPATGQHIAYCADSKADDLNDAVDAATHYKRVALEMGGKNAIIVYINAGTIGSKVHLPFGGIKDTGNGPCEAGQAALDTFSEWKSIYIDYSGQLQRAQIDT